MDWPQGTDCSPPLVSCGYDPTTDDSISSIVVRAVASVSNREPTDLSPLGGTIDTDALETVVDSSVTNGDASVALSFAYEGYLVRIDSDGTIALHETSGWMPGQYVS